jgi:hypothetical protein
MRRTQQKESEMAISYKELRESAIDQDSVKVDELELQIDESLKNHSGYQSASDGIPITGELAGRIKDLNRFGFKELVSRYKDAGWDMEDHDSQRDGYWVTFKLIEKERV